MCSLTAALGDTIEELAALAQLHDHVHLLLVHVHLRQEAARTANQRAVARGATAHPD